MQWKIENLKTNLKTKRSKLIVVFDDIDIKND